MARKTPKKIATVLAEQLRENNIIHFVINKALQAEYERVLDDEEAFIKSYEGKRPLVSPELYVSSVKQLKEAFEVNQQRGK